MIKNKKKRMTSKEIIEYFCIAVSIIFALCLVLLFCISSIDEKNKNNKTKHNVNKIVVKQNNDDSFNTIPDCDLSFHNTTQSQ